MTLATPKEVLRLIDRSPVLALDLETTSLNPREGKIRLLSLSNGTETVVLDAFQYSLQPLVRALAGRTLIAHNALFDLSWLWHLGLRDLPHTICTYLTAQVLTAGEGSHGFPPLGLGECCKRWLKRPLDKTLQKSDWSGPLTPEQIRYAADDVQVLPPLLRALYAEVEKAGLMQAVEVELRALPAFVWMAQSGVPFDPVAWTALANKAEADLVEIEAKLDGLAPHKGQADLFGERPRWNWASPKQVGEVLDMLGVPVPSTNDYYLAETKHPIGAVLRRHRQVSKRIGTYGKEWLRHVAGDGRVYANWRQLGAASGRSSCSEPNMQQLPRDRPKGEKTAVYRACVKAPPGRVLVKADYSQVELRLACKIARENKMLEAYQTGQDLHVLTAALLLGKPADKVTADDRQIAKSANFGLLYGMGAAGYRAYASAEYGVDLTEEQAARYRDTFFAAYPGLVTWHQQVKRRHATETRTLTGRRRLLSPDTPDTWRVNTPVQGTGADGLKKAIGILWRRRHECPDANLILVAHDEAVVEADAGNAETVKAWLVEAMEDGMRDLLVPVPCVVEAKACATWGG